MEVNIAHIQLTVASFEACSRFYQTLMAFFGMTLVYDDRDLGVRYWVGDRTLAINRVGPFHVRFRARTHVEVDAAYELVQKLGANIVHGPRIGAGNPGGYSVLFEDPDGIRLEVSCIPRPAKPAPEKALVIRRIGVPE